MFRTEISHIYAKAHISIGQKLLSIGSCFAQNVGTRLSEFKFDIQTNPTGILFNPLSVFEQLEYAISDQRPDEATYLESQGIHLNFKFHSENHAESKDQLEDIVDNKLRSLGERLKATDHLVLTFGTAWVHKLKASGQLVANCHKLTQEKFTKHLLTSAEIVEAFSKIHNSLISINPNLKIILTVSPIRHTREGLAENNLSKSVLRLACHEIQSQHENVGYFPAFEIMIDDLRDYRFFEKDLIHPNELAKDYIWQKFSDAYFDEKTLEFRNQWTSILNDLSHRAFHPSSPQHQKFLEATLSKLENLNYPVDVDNEIQHIKDQLE